MNKTCWLCVTRHVCDQIERYTKHSSTSIEIPFIQHKSTYLCLLEQTQGVIGLKINFIVFPHVHRTPHTWNTNSSWCSTNHTKLRPNRSFSCAAKWRINNSFSTSDEVDQLNDSSSRTVQKHSPLLMRIANQLTNTLALCASFITMSKWNR